MPYLLTLLPAVICGYLARWAGIPNGLLIGAMGATLLTCRLYPRSLLLPCSLEYVQITLGLSIGLLFEHWDSRYALSILPSIGLLLLCLALQIGAAWGWLTRVSRWTKAEALLAAYPGAMAAVMDLLDRQQASPKVILVHIARLLLLTLLASLVIQSRPGVWPDILPLAGAPALLSIAGIIAASIASGYLLARLQVPAPYMLTAILCTAEASRLGLARGWVVPDAVMDAGVVLLGALIAIRFKLLSRADILDASRAACGALAASLLATVAVAALAAWLLSNDLRLMLLAYVPGGVESVAAVALAGGLNVIFIMTHHMTRLLVLNLAPALLARSR